MGLFGEKVSEEVHIEISNGIAIWLYWSIAMWTCFFYLTVNSVSMSYSFTYLLISHHSTKYWPNKAKSDYWVYIYFLQNLPGMIFTFTPMTVSSAALGWRAVMSYMLMIVHVIFLILP
jgi:hypothetical protein